MLNFLRNLRSNAQSVHDHDHDHDHDHEHKLNDSDHYDDFSLDQIVDEIETQFQLPQPLKTAIDQGVDGIVNYGRALSKAKQPWSADDSAASFAYAYSKNLPLATKQSLFELQLRNGAERTAVLSTAWHFALDHRDLPFAKVLLQAAPPPVIPPCAEQRDMLRLMHLARQTKQLYRTVDAQQLTPLDHALQSLDHEGALRLLNQTLQQLRPDFKPHKPLTLRVAQLLLNDLCKQGKHSDLSALRALALLWPAKLFRSLTFPAQCPAAGVAALAAQRKKEIPYRPAKYMFLDNFNMEVNFADSANQIACRHLSTYWAMHKSSNPKFDISTHAEDEKAIADNIPADMEKLYQSVKTGTNEIHIFDNQHFGAFAHALLSQMQQQGVHSKVLVFDTCNHSMALRFAVKPDGYAIELYDPNQTKSQRRMKSADLDYIASLQMSDFLSQDVLDENQLTKKPVVAYAIPNDLYHLNPEAHAQTRVHSTHCDLSPAMIWLLMRSNAATDIRALAVELEKLPETERFGMLDEAVGDGPANALNVACGFSYAESIRAFGALLKTVPMAQRAALFGGYREHGLSDRPHALSVLMCNGDAQTFTAFAELFALLPSNAVKNILLAREPSYHAATALSMSLKRGQVEAIRAYGKLLNYLPEQDQREVLRALALEIRPLLPAASKAGQHEAVQALLALWPPSLRSELTAASS